jgi:sugar O-acyltransferase (sialic acid O-acetyltransferase NeuD family)
MRKLQPLILWGVSPFSEIYEIIKDINNISPTYEVIGILDDNKDTHGKVVDGIKVLGPLELCYQFENVKFLNCIGSHRTRIVKYEIIKKLNLPKDRFVTLIHPTAKIYSSSIVEEGCIIHKGAIVFNDTVIQSHVEILANSVIGAKNIVYEGAMVTSLVATTVGVRIGPYSHIGTHSCIGENVNIGAGAQIGMGSVVLKDVPPGVFCLGNPLRFLNKIDVPLELIKITENEKQ